MVKLDIEGERAAKLLSEGNPKPAIEEKKEDEAKHNPYTPYSETEI